MVALCIDTAASKCAVALNDLHSGSLLASISHDINRGHAEVLMDIIDQCMRRAQIGYEDVERIITTIGPGSFTGVRVGVAAARAIGLGLSKPVIGISNLQACAAYAQTIAATKGEVGGKGTDGDIARNIFVIIDARREEVYFQRFTNSAPVCDPMICRLDTLLEETKLFKLGDVICCGSGAATLLERMATSQSPAQNHVEAVIVHHQATAPIEVIAALGLAAPVGKFRPEPLYLRQADAKSQAGFAVPLAATSGGDESS